MASVNKERLGKLIADWLSADNEIGAMQRRQNMLKKQRAGFADELVKEMKMLDLEGIDTAGGQIQYSLKKTKKPITKKMLATALSAFYPNDEETAAAIRNFIMDRREESLTDTISHKKKT
jgi:hypothetical protein